jgi:uncharacterized protein YndB with AHSA1/START domain
MNSRIARMLVLAILMIVTTGSAAVVEPVVTEGMVNAPIEEVWKAFTTKDGIESWTVTMSEFELRVGATWRTSYNKDSNLNDDGAIHHTILAYDPGRMLAFRTIKPPRGFPFPNEISKAWTVVYFESAGSGRTKVTTHMLGFEDNAESQKMRAFFEVGNKTTMNNLIKKFQ